MTEKELKDYKACARLMKELIAICENMDKESYDNWRRMVLNSVPKDSTAEIRKLGRIIMEEIVKAVDKYTGHTSELVLN